jgi:hypothetical protein
MTQKINPKQRMGYGVFYSFRGVELEVRPKITQFFLGEGPLQIARSSWVLKFQNYVLSSFHLMIKHETCGLK